MTAQPHDAFFKAAFASREHARAMVHRLAPDLELHDPRLIAWETMQSEPTSFVDPELDPSHTDLLFSVQMAGAPAYIYFLLEHQSTTDHDMPYRVLKYLTRIWDHHRTQQRAVQSKRARSEPLPVVLVIVISNVVGGWRGPLSFHDMCRPHPTTIRGLRELVPNFDLLLLDLSELSDEELKSWALAAFPKIALFALRDARDPEKLLQGIEHWGDLIAEAAEAPSGMDSIRQLMRYVARASPSLNVQDFRAKIRQYLPKAETELMTIYEQARQEGLQEGRHEERVAVLARLLTLKFGELPSEYAERLQTATVEDLGRYLERILTADSLAAVFGDPTVNTR